MTVRAVSICNPMADRSRRTSPTKLWLTMARLAISRSLHFDHSASPHNLSTACRLSAFVRRIPFVAFAQGRRFADSLRVGGAFGGALLFNLLALDLLKCLLAGRHSYSGFGVSSGDFDGFADVAFIDAYFCGGCGGRFTNSLRGIFPSSYGPAPTRRLPALALSLGLALCGQTLLVL